MLKVSARRAKKDFSALLARVERGERVLIVKRGSPVAVLTPYGPSMTPARRQEAIRHAVEIMKQGLPWGDALQAFRREDMHER